MPIPKPKTKETKEDFITRFMSSDIMVEEYPIEEQRLAIAHMQWENKAKLSTMFKDIKMADIQDLFSDDYAEISNIEILNQYENAHGLHFTDADMDEMLSNWQELSNEGTLKPNVKISHSDQQLILQELFKFGDVEYGEELPNIGMLENLRVKDTSTGKAIYADIKKIPKVLQRVYGGLYTSLSPEIVPNWRGEKGKVIRGIVLSNNPSQKHVPDVYSMSAALRYDGNIFFIEGGNEMPVSKNEEGTSADFKLSDEQLEAALKDDGFLVRLADKMKGVFIKDGDKNVKTVEKDKTGKSEDVITLSSAEYDKLKNGLDEINELKKKLIEKDEAQVNLSATVNSIRENARKEKTEALCSKAKMDGVPTVVVDKLKPILLSDMSENTIKLSHMVDDKMVEADIPLYDIVKDVFENYPGERVNMSDKTSTALLAPGNEAIKKVNARADELVKQGIDRHTALTQAGQEILK